MFCQLCDRPCLCPAPLPQCPPGVLLVPDGCRCCQVCARQRGQSCSAVLPCDSQRGLQCDYSASFPGDTGECVGECVWARQQTAVYSLLNQAERPAARTPPGFSFYFQGCCWHISSDDGPRSVIDCRDNNLWLKTGPLVSQQRAAFLIKLNDHWQQLRCPLPAFTPSPLNYATL